MDSMGGQDKLVGRLRLNLDSLRGDISSANKVLEDINKIKIDSIDVDSGKQSIEILRQLETEFEKLKTASGNTFDTTIFSKMEEAIKSTGVEIQSTITKLTDVTTKDSEGTITAIQRIIEKTDELGKTVKSVQALDVNTKNPIDGSEKITSTSMNTASAYKESLSGIKNAYSELNTSGNATITEYEKLQEKTTSLIETDKISNTQKQQALNLNNQIASGINKIEQAQIKEAEATEKANLASLKQYTQDQASLSQYNKMYTILQSISGEKQLAMGSGDASNTMMDRVKISGAYAVAAQGIYMVRNAFTEAITTNRDYESSLTDLKRILGDVTNNDLKAYGQQAIQFAKDFGEPLQAVQDAMSSLAAAGIQDKQGLTDMTKTVMMGVNTSDIKDASQMTELLISSMKQLGIATSDSEKLLDSWNYSADKHIAKTSDYANAVAKVGAVSKSVGVDVAHLNATVSVLADNTGATGTEIGDAVKSMDTKMLLPKTIKTLQEYGIEIMKDATHYKDFGDIYTQVSEKLNQVGENSVAGNAIENALGGTMRKNWVDILAKNYGQVETAAKEYTESTGYSATKSAATMETLEKKVEQFNAAIKQFYVGLGDNGLSSQLKGVVDFGTWLATTGSKATGFLLTLAEVSAAIKTISVGLKIVTNQNLTQWLDKLDLSALDKLTPPFASFNKGTTSATAYGKAVESLTQQIKNGNISEEQSATILGVIGEKMGIAKSSTNVLAAAEESLNAKVASGTITQEVANTKLDELKVKMEASTTSTEAATASEEALNMANKSVIASKLALNAVMAVGTLALTFAITEIISYVDWLSKADERQQQALSDGADSAKKYSDEAKSIQDLVSQYQQLTASGKTDSDTKTQLLSIQSQLLTSYGSEAKGLDLVNGKYDDQIKKLQALSKQKADDWVRENQTSIDNAKTALSESSTSSLGHYSGSSNRIQSVLEKTNGVSLDESGASAQYDINGTLKQRVTILKQILDNITPIQNRTSQEKQVASEISNEYTKLKTNMDNAQKVMNELGSNNLVSKYSSEMAKMQSDASIISSSTDTSAVKKANDEFNSLYNTISKSVSKSPELKNALKDWKDGLNLTGTAAKTASSGISTTADSLSTLTTKLTTSTDKIKDYSKYIKDMNSNSGKLSSANVQDILKSHTELIPYLSDEKTLYQQIQKGISSENDTAQYTYSLMKSGNIDLVNKLKNDYGIDLANYTSVEDAKRKVGADTLTALATAQEKYNNIVGAGELQGLAKGGYNPNGFSDIESKAKNTVDAVGAKAELDKAQAAKDDFEKTISALQKSSNISDVIKQMSDVSEGNESTSKAEAAAKAEQTAKKKALENEKKDKLKALEDTYKTEKKYNDDITNGIQKQLDDLEKKKQLTNDTNDLLKDQNAVVKAQAELKNAQDQKINKEYIDGKWQWIANRNAVQQAQDKLQQAEDTLKQKQDDIAYNNQKSSLEDQLKAAQDKQSTDDTNYNNQKDSITSSYDDKINALEGYAVGGTVDKDKVAKLGEDGAEIVLSPTVAQVAKGTQVFNANDTEKILSGTQKKQLLSSTSTAISPIVQSTNKALSEIDNSIGSFVDNSPKYARDTNRNIGDNITNTNRLLKTPLNKLVNEVKGELQDFVNKSGQYAANSNKNIGDNVTSSSGSVINPTTLLIQNVDSALKTFADNSIQYGSTIDTQIGQGITDGEKDLDKTVADLTVKVITQFREGFGIHSPSKVMYEIGGFLMQGLINGMSESDIEKFITEKISGMTNSAGGVVSGNIADLITQALGDTDTPMTWLSGLEMIASRESGTPGQLGTGNANLVNSISVGDQFATGLMQMLPSTFQEYMKSGHGNILNPLDNLESSIDYIKQRYGSVYNIPDWNNGNYKGYALGSNNTEAGLAYVNENGQEMRLMGDGDGVVTAHRTQAISDFADKIPDIMSYIKTPQYEIPNTQVNIPNSNGAVNNNIIEKLILSNAVDGQQIVDQLIQVFKTQFGL